MKKPALADLIATPATSSQLSAAIANLQLPHVDGASVTFLYHASRDNGGPAESVSLRHWIYGLPTSIPMSPIGKTGYWFRVLEFPEGSRIEYKLGVTRNGREEWVHDPLNPNIAHDPFGGNSVVHCTGYQVPKWVEPNEDVPSGTVSDVIVDSRVFGDSRVVRVYQPSNMRDYRRYRLLIVHDGDDYLRYCRMQTVLDNLIGRLDIPPMIVAFTNPGDRLREYANDERHARHVVEEIIPTLESSFPLIAEASGRCLMGASFGGVATLSAAWRFPEAFGSLLLQSGSFAFTDIGDHTRAPAFDPVVRFMNAFRSEPGAPARRVFVSCGVYESLIYENRSLVPFLQEHGMEVKFVESRDGHNWENWRDRLRDGLTWLFPGPLWVTYM